MPKPQRQTKKQLAAAVIATNGHPLATSANVHVPPPVPPKVFSLAHPGIGQYDFHPQPVLGTVGIVYTNRRGADRQTLSTEEARELWSRLLSQGFVRF